MTAKTKDGKEVLKSEKIYMLHAGDSRNEGDQMVYGPANKLGFLEDNTFQPLQTKVESYDLKFPEGVKELDVNVELRFQYDKEVGTIGKDSYILYKTSKKVSTR
ncbi:MAG: hypothetical protein HZA15_17595 [Nitrospirae bacterium]|nr:hypothetical protein [Nitrospirota bacterium]